MNSHPVWQAAYDAMKEVCPHREHVWIDIADKTLEIYNNSYGS